MPLNDVTNRFGVHTIYHRTQNRTLWDSKANLLISGYSVFNNYTLYPTGEIRPEPIKCIASYTVPSNGLFAEALNELYVKKNKIHHYPTRNCDKYHIQTSTDSFLSNVSARFWNVITTNINVNISFMQFKVVLKLYLHENEVILKYTK